MLEFVDLIRGQMIENLCGKVMMGCIDGAHCSNMSPKNEVTIVFFGRLKVGYDSDSNSILYLTSGGPKMQW